MKNMTKGGEMNRSILIDVFIKDKQKKISLDRRTRAIMRNAAKAACQTVSDATGTCMRCQMDLSVVDNEKIMGLNTRFRDIPSATDVLSFPLLDMSEGILGNSQGDIDPVTGRMLLGDLVISLEMALNKSAEQNIGFDEELAFLTVHGTLHLLGYDHSDVETESVMNDLTRTALIIAGYQELAADL